MIPALAGFMAGGAPAINVINALADTGATSTGALGSFAVGSGSNRLLGLIQHMTGSTDTISAMTWGGQSMTQRVAIASAGSFQARVKIWTMSEAAIAAAVGTAFGMTGTVNGGYRATAFALENVDQASPVVDSGSGVFDGSNPADVVLSTVAGGYAVAGVTFDNTTDTDISWAAPFTRQAFIEFGAVPGGNSAASADTLTTGANVTSDVTTGDAGNNQQCQAGVSFRPA